ncbi:uncharacterized protein LOC124280415 isoform X2 [Haliotis rubra]|uniref:uncharacterized protein LOC124280415 isoform X2 n=1 Tax=Haliotis rubra TaxID=36100 RepID=UPI001EE5BE84|nr:uncharacterized protein LOC124280415 isoform X2 [Haliotis rubra]
MGDLHIRCTLNGQVITDDPSHVVVDVFFNECFLERGTGQTGELLACLHWEEPEEAVTSTVELKPTKDNSSVEDEFCRRVIQEKKHLYSFVSEVYETINVRLVAVRSPPLHFTFRHPRRTPFPERSDEFFRLLRKFVCSCVSLKSDINVALKSDGQYTVPCTTFFHSFNQSGERFDRRTKSTPGTQSVQQQPLHERFALIEEEISSQRELLTEHDVAHREQIKNIKATLIRVLDYIEGSTPSVEEMALEGSEASCTAVDGSVTKQDIVTGLDFSARDMSSGSVYPGGMRSIIHIGTLSADNDHENEFTKDTSNQEELSNLDRCASSQQHGVTSDLAQCNLRATNTEPEPELADRLTTNAQTHISSVGKEDGLKKQPEKDNFAKDTSAENSPKEPSNVEHRAKRQPHGRNSSSELLCQGMGRLASVNVPDVTDLKSMLVTMRRDNRETLSKLAKGGRFDTGVTKEGRAVTDSFLESMRQMTEYRSILENIPGATSVLDGMMGAYEEAITSGDSEGIPKALGLDTVLCLDTSGSMRGDALIELKKTARELIDGIEDIAEEHSIEENVALVTFGGTARIAHHLTNDYESLRDCIDGLEAHGTTPLLQGLVVALSCLVRGGICNFGGIKTTPRIIFITDGLATVEGEVHMEDGTRPCEQAKLCVISSVNDLGHDGFKCAVAGPIVWIPVGNADKSFLESLSTICKGEFVEKTDMKRLSRYQHIRRLSSSVLACVRSEDIDPAEFHHKLDVIIDAITHDVTTEEKDEVEAIVREQLCSVEVDLGATDDFSNAIEYGNLPPLGTRVERGPDWKWGNQDADGPGTVINHGQSADSLWVKWDNGGRNVYRYGEESAFDVLIADYLPRVVEHSQITIGVQVERGPHWLDAYQDQDGGPGSLGTVIRKRGHKVKVRWENGDTFNYNYGENNTFELKLRDPFSCQTVQVPETNGSLCSTGQSNGRDEDKPGAQYVWQRSDDGTTWHNYSEEEDSKLKKEYEKRKTGSCLLTRNGESFRVSFKTNTERAVTNKTTAHIRKRYADK